VTRRATDYPAAMEHLDTLREPKGEPRPDQILERALLAAQQGELPTSEGYLRSCLQSEHPQAELILEALERGCLRVNRLDDAMLWLDQLLRRQPENVIALVDRGTLFEGLGNLDKALETYQAAHAVQPNYKGARLRLGQLLLQLNRPAEALPHFEHLHTWSPRQAETTLGLAQCQFALDRHDLAAELLTSLLAEDPNNGKALLLRGRVALAAGGPEMAEGWLRRAVACLPGNQQANYNLGLCLGRLGKEAEAASYFRRADEIGAELKHLVEVIKKAVRSPADPEPRLEAGQICLRVGQDGQGLRWLQGALAINKNHQPTHAALADYYDRVGRKDLAARHRLLAGSPPPSERAP
jgi:tetratricopeptide (TPR) repeat protein